MVPAAVGMNSTEFKGRPACIYDGWCHVGCPIGALANPVVTYLGDARKAGAEVRARSSTVTRILTNAAGNKVTGVEYYDEKQRSRCRRRTRRARRLGRAESAATPQLRDRQAPQRPRQFRAASSANT